MGIEIERKFLVVENNWKQHTAHITPSVIRQGYLSTEPERTVRVRVKDKQAYLTIKGKTESFSRSEFEYQIPVNDGEALLLLCKGPLIEKNRYEVEVGQQIWEVDEFFGENSGLVIAEAELATEEQELDPPSWIGKEVTGDRRYYNSYLSTKPFTQWE